MRKNLERLSKFAKNVCNDNLRNNGFKNNVQESCRKRLFAKCTTNYPEQLVAKNLSQFEKSCP